MSEDLQTQIDTLKKEKDNFLYLSIGLPYDHQLETKLALLRKANNIQGRIDELELLIKNEQ